MMGKDKKETPEIVIRDGKPVAVILDIERYLELLEMLEDAEDLRMLRRMRARQLKFRKLEDFLSDYQPKV
ncbi:MAG: type II toxin-antitoxin system Phd/YefM family antitoxin [candidate division WOR-3 bacterium]